MKVFLSYALSLVGLGVVAAAVIGATLVNLSYPAARMRLLQMIAQSLNKAELMCKTAKNTFYEPIGNAIKIGAMAQTTDLSILQQSTTPSYDAACMSVTLHWKALFRRGKMGVMMVVGGVALAMSNKGQSAALHIIVAIVTAIAVAWFFFTRNENERSLMRARAEILPEVNRAFAEGRYARY